LIRRALWHYGEIAVLLIGLCGIVGQREYNRVQRETLDLCKEVEEGIGADEGRNKEEPYESLAITLSNIANVVLLIIKV